jgi:hypothetical protein
MQVLEYLFEGSNPYNIHLCHCLTSPPVQEMLQGGNFRIATVPAFFKKMFSKPVY